MEWTVSPPDGSGFENVMIQGDCDLYATPAFEKGIRERMDGGAKRLRLDFSGVSYLDSTGVGAIIKLLRTAKGTGCELRFRGISGSPRKVLKMTNVLVLMREDAPQGEGGHP